MAKEHEKPVEGGAKDQDLDAEMGKGPEPNVSAGLQSEEMLQADGKDSAAGGETDPAAAQAREMQQANTAAAPASGDKGPSPEALQKAAKVPKNVEGVRTHMKDYQALKDYPADRPKIKDPDIRPYLDRCKEIANEAQALHDSKKAIPRSMKAEAKQILDSAMEKAAEKDPKQSSALRAVYDDMALNVIPSWQTDLEAGQVDIRTRAQLAVMHRNAFKIVVREHQGEKYLVQVMEFRNRIHYNNPVGPKFESLVTKMEDKKKLKGDDIYQAIIGKAQKPNTDISNIAKGK